MNSTAEILRKARALISDEASWTQGDYCKVNGKGRLSLANQRLPSGSECFCAIGSIAWANDITIREAESGPAYELLASMTFEEDGVDVHEYNDTHDHSDVLALFDRAIARAESEPA